MLARRLAPLFLPFALVASPIGSRTFAAEEHARAPVSPAEAPSRMKVPPGFKVTLFAAEPDVVQPIAFTIDPKGRLWVVENTSYPIWLGGPKGKDRILIFEDGDGDGRFDRRTVFYDRGTNFTGVELGFGGVWVCATPNLLFFPDKDGDDRPDSEPAVVLDGWDVKAEHNMFNALKWGPDGWLWGCNGIMSNSNVGKPGTPDDRRTKMNCGVWRYHPTRQAFEVVAHGTTNPWGLDFDARGEAFITNCVIPHLFHVAPGAHFQRMYGQDMNPNSYGLMQTCADHLHWAGGNWTESREGKGHERHDAAGGGHAHVGAMIYQGDNWPDAYRGALLTFNLHGHRANHDRLERSGSGYVARHEKDFLLVDDSWFRGLELKYGPDGAVYFTDWTDRGECHDTDADNAHRENGRIYKLSYGDIKPAKVDLAAMDDERLAWMVLHKNEWYVRTSRRLLQERAAAGADMTKARHVLAAVLTAQPEMSQRLRALWALYAIGGIDDRGLEAHFNFPADDLRGWAVRLRVDREPPSGEGLAKLVAMIRAERSPSVLLSLASAMQRIPVAERWAMAEAFAAAKIDPADPMLPLMIWYGLEPLAAEDPGRALAIAARCGLPLHRNYLARRAVSADPEKALPRLLDAASDASDEARRDLLAGAIEALRGRKHVARPGNWPAAFAKLAASHDPEVVERTLLLGLDLEDPRALSVLRKTATDAASPADLRARALSVLVERRVPGLEADLLPMLDDPSVRARAIRALAAYNDPATPRAILDRYASLPEPEREDAVSTLAGRPAWALALLDAVEQKRIPRRDVTTTIARQLLAMNDAKVKDRLAAAWGTIRSTAGEKASLIPRYKEVLASDKYPAADPSRGRLVFNRTCHQCHRLFDSGGDVGPELTGSDRANPDYILENVLDPSASVAREYKLTNVATTDGRIVAGIIRAQDDKSLTIQTANERIVLPREDVEDVKTTDVSMMPEGQLERFTPEEIRDLFAYLASRVQVAPAKAEKN
ncbi:Cytochrome c [Aquisphaera giovannonii]|uniref:Cytochrome c n=1 Tax=Aquisphaera giovannonii TaxID=406548 RepID=A0A5B9WFQ9_9BACT|nr:PVC-type heme-binding CxxCH protein [Aquisphaera giovannonii]QEH38821.1 Cytochrome c [Aquisphaera giovannonii]